MRYTARLSGALHVGIATGLICLIGCKSQQPDTTPNPRTEYGSVSWGGQNPPKDAVPGIDFATVNWALWNDEVVFAMWDDRNKVGNYGAGHTGSKPKPGQWDAEYTFRFGDVRVVEVKCKTSDGKTGTITVNGEQPLELAAGNLLLISTAGGMLHVKQLKRDGLTGKPNRQDNPPECYVKLKADPEIQAFFALAKKPGKE